MGGFYFIFLSVSADLKHDNKSINYSPSNSVFYIGYNIGYEVATFQTISL